MAKEFGWSTNDLLDLSGHDLIGLVKRILDWKKNNSQMCPFMVSSN